MQVSVQDFNPTDIRPVSDSTHERTPGLHLSQIYDDLSATIQPRPPMNGRDLHAYRAGGFLWERVLETSFSTAFAASLTDSDTIRPGEIIDPATGIIASPDLIHLPSWSVWDTKFTWRSSRRLECPPHQLPSALAKHFWTWTVQLKGYCRMLGMVDARLLVFWCMGNYADSGPQLKQYDLQFTPRELDENWSMLINHARKRGWLPR